MKGSKRKASLAAVMILIIAAVMLPCTAAAVEKSGKAPKITLNSSDPFEFRTIKEKEMFLDGDDDLPESYDLRDEGCVTPVKLQNPFGSCWGFAAISAAETSLLGSGLADQEGYDASTLDLSEKQLAYFASSYVDFGGHSQDGEGTHHRKGTAASDIMNIGGNPVLATNTFASGTGPCYESKPSDPEWPSEEYKYKGKNGNIDRRWFDGKYQDFCYSAEDDWSMDKSIRFKQSFVLKTSYMLPSPCVVDIETEEYSYNPAGTVAIKKQLLAKRGVEVGFSADTSSPNQELGEDGMFLSTKTWAHYTWFTAPANHAVQIVGWDDNYSRDNFIEDHKPPEDMFPDGRHPGATDGGNGAWLIKNSWGSGEEEFPNKGEGKWGIKKNGVNTGYFWISYYDQSLSSPEALEFDKANESGGYYLDQYDYMQAHFLLTADKDDEAKMSNVFQAEESEELEAVSCQTVAPNTDVTFEVYLLKDTFQGPEDGILVAKMEDSYEYGGFHKKNVEPCGILGDSPVIIQKGQYYSIVVTQKTSEEKYIVNTPMGFADDNNSSHYDVGIINQGESFVKINGEWNDYSYEEVRNTVFVNPPIDNPEYDNFPIKGFCRPTGNDIAIRMTGKSEIRVFRGEKTTFNVRLTGSKDAVIPDDPEITWQVYDPEESGTEFVSIELLNNSSRALITPKEQGKIYLVVTVEDVGTTVLPIMIYRMTPMVVYWHDHDEQNRPLGAVYTGEPVMPEVDVALDSPYSEVLIKDQEYTIEYVDNIKCGAGMISVNGAGELEPTIFVEPFPIVPQKAAIEKVTAGAGCVTVNVKDQKASGITGYRLEYREQGTEKWKAENFSSDKTSLKLTGLTAGKKYEVRAAAYVDIPKAKRGWALLASYAGEPSEISTVSVKKAAGTKITSLKADKKKKTATVKWKKVAGVTGYKISYSTSSKFKKGTKTVTVKKAGTAKAVVRKLKRGKKYYFRIRTYTVNGSKKIYSKWSGKKSVKL